MKKFIHRLIFIVLAGLFLFTLSQGRLSDLPGFDYVVAFLWGGVVVMAVLALAKRKGLWLILLGLLGGQVVCASSWAASSVQGYYPTYCAKIEQAKQNHWKGDEACEEEVWEEARYITSKQKGEPPASIAPDTTCSCSSDYDCAKKLMQICSEYERRHHLEDEKNKKVHTVVEILALDNSGCWPCDMAAVIFVVIQTLSFQLNEFMVKVAFMLLKLIFFGWIVFVGASAVFFPNKSGTFASQVLIRTIGVALVAIVLSTNGMTTLYTKFLNPVMNMGIGLSEKISEVALPSATLGEAINALVPSSAASSTTTMDYCSSDESETFSGMMGGFLPSRLSVQLFGWGSSILSSSTSKSKSYMAQELSKQLVPLNTSGEQETLLNDDMKKDLLCMTQKFYNQVSPFTAVGRSLIEFARADEASYFGVKWPDIKMWVTGWLLVIIFTVFSFLVAFKIMDIFLRLGLFLVLIPWFVAAVAFPITRDFAAKGWNFFLHTIVEFLGLALAIALCMEMFEKVVSTDSDALKKAIIAPYTEDYGKNLYNVIYSEGAGRFFFMLAIAAYFAFQILKMVTPMLENLFGVSGVATGSIFGGMAMTAMNRTRQLSKKAKELADNKNLRYKSDKTLKKEEIAGLKKAEAEQQKVVADLNNRVIIAQNDVNSLQHALDENNRLLSDLLRKTARKSTIAERAEIARLKKEIERIKSKLAEAKAQLDAEKKKLDEEKKKLAEIQAQKAKAEADLKNTHLGFQQSSAKFAPRRYAENSVNALHYYSQRTAGGIENVLVGTGQFLNKTGIGAIVGVPLVYAGKLISWGLRGTTKTISTTVHAVGATPDALKNTVSSVVNAPENIAKGIANGVKNTIDTTKTVVGFSGHLAKKAVYDVPKNVAISAVKAPGAILNETKNVAGFTGHIAKKVVYDAPKTVVDSVINAPKNMTYSVINAPKNIAQGVKTGVQSVAQTTKNVAGFSGYMAKKVVVDAPKQAIKTAVMAPVNIGKKTASAVKGAVKFPVDLAKKIFK